MTEGNKSKPLGVVRERVRWNDVDWVGVMWYGAYTRMLEIGETETFRDLGYPYLKMRDELGIYLMRVHLEIDYRSPGHLDDELEIATYLSQVGRSSLRLEFTISHPAENRTVANVNLVLACVDAKTLKSTPLHEDLAALLRSKLPA